MVTESRDFHALLKKTLSPEWQNPDAGTKDRKVLHALQDVATQLDDIMWDPQFRPTITTAWANFLKTVEEGFSED